MKTQHTPGPWKLEPYTLNIVANKPSLNGGPIVLASAYAGPHIVSSEKIANGKIIAAAPELLHALIHLYQWQRNKGTDLTWVMDVIKAACPEYEYPVIAPTPKSENPEP